ncbi:citrate/2-methylcitrate synthase [Georgenia sp. AZ-5]|uniref:citrate/2-methylcitrate synthase n=1 Tax=Georgenia sp. AZ-5 TaxID=3367526 RepID=UPI003754701B
MPTTPASQRTPGPDVLFAVGDTGMPTYRGVDVGTLVGTPFERVWGLLVDGAPTPGLPPAEPFNLPTRTGDVRVDVQSALAQLGPVWAYRPLAEVPADEARDNLARASVMVLSLVAQSARGADVPAVPQREIDLAPRVTERFLVRWRGEADPVAVEALDVFWLTVAEDGLSPSTRTVRLAAEVGADAASSLSAAVAVAGGPFGGGAVSRGLALLDRVERAGDADAALADHLARDRSLPGFGDQQVPLDARVELLREACVGLGARRVEAADALVDAVARSAVGNGEGAGVAHRPNALLWGTVLLDGVGVPAWLVSALYMCGRTAGWSAHLLEVHRELHP